MRWTLLVLVLSTGCASLYQMRLPSKGGPPWTELQSDHFTLQTDLDERAARETLLEFENRRTGLIAAAWHNASFRTARTRVVAFIDTEELEEFAVPGVLGFARRGTGHDRRGEAPPDLPGAGCRGRP
ncbi:MAG: hypothetical protein NVS4B10_12230 [Myxococcales bacterium]